MIVGVYCSTDIDTLVLPYLIGCFYVSILQDLATYQLLGPLNHGIAMGEAHNKGLHNKSHIWER